MEGLIDSVKKMPIGRLVVLAFVVIGFALYFNSFSNKMFWDDDDFILKNEYIKDWKYIPKYFSKNVIAGANLLSNYWRPVLLSVFSLEWHIWKDWLIGWHFINTSFHIADAILLFFILFYLFKNRWLAFLAGLVFLVHPLQTEAVVYVNSLGDSLSVFFIFLGIIFYLKFRLSGKSFFENSFYFFSLLMYVLALMSKETAIIMPGLIFIIELFFSGFGLNLKERLKKTAKAVWPFFLIAGFYILLRATVLNFNNTFNLYGEENVFTSNFYVRLFTFFRILTIYFGLLFVPFNLHMERTAEIATSFFSPSVVLGAILFFGLLGLAFQGFRKYPILSFGIFWFFIGISVTSNLAVPINGLLYEHWLYLPLIGIFLALVWLGMVLGQKYGIKEILLVLFIIYLIFFGILTIKRNRDWRNPIVFYEQVLGYAPDSYRVLNNLGMAYSDVKDYNKAEENYVKAINLYPSGPVAYHNLANLYKERGKIDLAVENFNKALKLDPDFVFSYNSLAQLYLDKKDYKKALEVLERRGSFIDNLFLLAEIACNYKDYQMCLDYLERALEVDPDNIIIKQNIAEVKKMIK